MSDANDPDGEPVPKLPRGRGLKLAGPDLFRILMTVMTLIGVIVLTRPCANSVSKFVTDMDKNGSGAKTMPTPESVAPPAPAGGEYETLRPDMTEAELKAAIERSKARAAAQGSGSGSGGGSAGSAGTGSAEPPPSRPAP